MKAYEKWARQNMYDRTETEKAWKAALEWALSHKKPIRYNDYKFDYIKIDVIVEELNE